MGQPVGSNPNRPNQAYLYQNYLHLGNRCTEEGQCATHIYSFCDDNRPPQAAESLVRDLRSHEAKEASPRNVRRLLTKKRGLRFVFEPQKRRNFTTESLLALKRRYSCSRLSKRSLYCRAHMTKQSSSLTSCSAVEFAMIAQNTNVATENQPIYRAHLVVEAYLIGLKTVLLKTESPIVLGSLMKTVQIPKISNGGLDGSAYAGIIAGIAVAGVAAFRYLGAAIEDAALRVSPEPDHTFNATELNLQFNRTILYCGFLIDTARLTVPEAAVDQPLSQPPTPPKVFPQASKDQITVILKTASETNNPRSKNKEAIREKQAETHKEKAEGEQGQAKASVSEEPSFGQSSSGNLLDLASFYYVDFEGPVENEEDLLKELNQSELVKAAYNHPRAQGYLKAAPGGIDAYYIHDRRGGKGDEMRIVDCESGWQFNHEDLFGECIAGINSIYPIHNNHGTAIHRIIGRVNNRFGIIGIALDAALYGCSTFYQSIAFTITVASGKLRREAFAAIHDAVFKKGIVVIEAAVNGSENLDHVAYGANPRFSNDWRNPFNPINPFSGAILVGPGYHPGQIDNLDRSRLRISNYGERVDCQAWGALVTSTASDGDLHGINNLDRRYTANFGGTSSAAAMIAGGVLCIQGTRRAEGRRLLNSEEYRRLLRHTGSPQQDGLGRPSTQRIGNQLDLRQLYLSSIEDYPQEARVRI
ncbi:peptidase S8/S53 domain-containing protein [Mariannaea sp. PMI_226]|nr:peptidase S8/S53 domain-containing protein [Mariannaea sp. PMI_226]